MRYTPPANWKPGPWASDLGETYFSEMAERVTAMTRGWFSAADEASGHADYIRARHIFGRMEICQRDIVPWLAAAIPTLRDMTVLEIGCGSGPATAPIAMVSKHVYAFDLDHTDLSVAEARFRLMGIDNVTLFKRPAGWTVGYAEDPSVISPPVEVIIAYALMEHLLPTERIDLLVGAWKHLPVGGYLVIMETHNRLYPHDWHSMYMPFADQVPDEIAFLWNAFSDRQTLPANIKAQTRAELAACSRERLYRFGRGVSFHEFHVALGADAYSVSDTPGPDRSRLKGWNAQDIANLERQLALVKPPVHAAFARPCLDLVIQKTGPSRLT